MNDALLATDNSIKTIIDIRNRDYEIGIILWGKEFREYFTDYMILSFLHPANMEILQRFRSVTLSLYTPDEDFLEIKNNKSFQCFSKKIKIDHHNSYPYDRDPKIEGKYTPHHLVGLAHIDMIDRSVLGKKLLTILYPDTVVSNSFFSTLCKYYNLGYVVCIHPSIPYNKEDLLPEIKKYRSDQHEYISLENENIASLLYNSIYISHILSHINENYFRYTGNLSEKLPDESIIFFNCAFYPIFMDAGEILNSNHSLKPEMDGLDNQFLIKLYNRNQPVAFLNYKKECLLASWVPKKAERDYLKSVRFSGNKFIMKLYRESVIRTVLKNRDLSNIYFVDFFLKKNKIDYPIISNEKNFNSEYIKDAIESFEKDYDRLTADYKNKTNNVKQILYLKLLDKIFLIYNPQYIFSSFRAYFKIPDYRIKLLRGVFCLDKKAYRRIFNKIRKN